jgi:hypothetical protein
MGGVVVVEVEWESRGGEGEREEGEVVERERRGGR